MSRIRICRWALGCACTWTARLATAPQGPNRCSYITGLRIVVSRPTGSPRLRRQLFGKQGFLWLFLALIRCGGRWPLTWIPRARDRLRCWDFWRARLDGVGRPRPFDSAYARTPGIMPGPLETRLRLPRERLLRSLACFGGTLGTHGRPPRLFWLFASARALLGLLGLGHRGVEYMVFASMVALSKCTGAWLLMMPFGLLSNPYGLSWKTSSTRRARSQVETTKGL